MEHKRIIIADDEALIRQDLREMLTNLGYLVIGDVGDGRSAVNLARELKPDLVIMDIRMPDMDGIEAARLLTEEGIAPVLLLSAYSQRDLVERAAEAGVSGYVIKPFDESNLLPAIEVVLARFGEYQEISKEAARLEERLETRVAVDRAKGFDPPSQQSEGVVVGHVGHKDLSVEARADDADLEVLCADER